MTSSFRRTCYTADGVLVPLTTATFGLDLIGIAAATGLVAFFAGAMAVLFRARVFHNIGVPRHLYRPGRGLADARDHALTIRVPIRQDLRVSVQYRQGDVLVVAVEAVPAGAVPVSRSAGELVLAEGEATGHRHAIADPHAELLELPGEEIERRFLRIAGATATLTHQEHDPIVLPPGLYQVIRQREYVPDPEPQPSRRRFRLVQD